MDFLNSTLFSVLTGLAGILIGQRLNIFNARRVEYNTIVDPLRDEIRRHIDFIKDKSPYNIGVFDDLHLHQVCDHAGYFKRKRIVARWKDYLKNYHESHAFVKGRSVLTPSIGLLESANNLLNVLKRV